MPDDEPDVATETAAFSADDIERFDNDGYVVLPGLLPMGLVRRIKAEVDHWVDSGLREQSIASAISPEEFGLPPLLELEMPGHGELLAHQPLLMRLAQLLGPSFVFHHLHSDRQPPGAPGKNWHHTEKTARAHLGTTELPGEVLISQLPPGSTLLLHSALFHARRPAPGTEGSERYMVDCSYGQVGVRWRPVKPHWRHVLAKGRELGLGTDQWPELFAERHFSPYEKSTSRRRGSRVPSYPRPT